MDIYSAIWLGASSLSAMARRRRLACTAASKWADIVLELVNEQLVLELGKWEAIR